MSHARLTLSRRHRVIGLGTVAVLAASLLVYVQIRHEQRGGRDVRTAAPGSFRTAPGNRTPLPPDGGTWPGPAAAAWPAPGSAELTLGGAPAGGKAGGAASGKAGGLPVKVAAKADKPAPSKIHVSVLDQQHSETLGVSGPVITVTGDSGEVDATVDYAGIAGLYGGDWAGRLTLTGLPACAAITPEREECQDAQRVDVVKSAGTTTVTTPVAMAAGALTVFAVTADTESDEGDYKASDLQASGSWSAGDGSGGFTYSNPVRVPKAPGATPEVSLEYSSQGVDGKMAGNNSQASWAGDGWDYSPGFVERSYLTCADDQDKVDGKDPNNKDKAKKTADQCWKDTSPNITVSLGGQNTSLVKDEQTGTWRAQQDDNWRIELEGGPATKDAGTSERWVITTPDGTRNYFAGEVATSNSRWTVPVFGNHDGERCHADAFKDSSCAQAWRWLLDKTVDTNGNVTRYYYTPETGYYGAAGDKKNRVSFVRGGHLTRIDYGLHTGYPNVAPTARVVFSTADRCFADCHKDGKPVKASWPDVPWDKECAGEPCTDKLAPVFFSTKRLTKITTQVRRGNDFPDVESWTLNQEFKSPKEQKSASLWLKEIVHAGHVGGTVTDPPVQFTGVELANRVNALAGAPLFSRFRIQNIRTEAGADIHVSYSDPDCDTHDLPKPEANNRLCYPVYWTPDGYFEPKLDWFRKYRVTAVTESDRTADQPAVTKTYAYSTDGGGTDVLWAWDDSEFTQKKHRTYGQWRGYARVTTTVGAPGTDNRLRTRKQFFRGLDDQPLPDDKTRNVQVTDSAGNAFTDHPVLGGSPLEEVTLDGDTTVEASTTSYWTKLTASRSRTGGTDKAYMVGPAVEKTRKLLAPGGWQRTETRTTYNDDGEPTSVSDLGDVDSSGDETCKRTWYVSNNGAWVRSVVIREETVAKACDQAVSRPADVVTDVKTYYDGSDSHGATPSKGDVTRQDTLDRWDGGPVYTTTARTSYDDLGRKISETDANGKVTTTAYTPAGPGPVTRTRTVNPLTHEVVTDQDPAFAQPTAIKDANGKLTQLQHDAMGRLTKVWLPGRALDKSPNMEFAYRIRNDGPLAVTTKRLGPNGGYRTEVGLFDSLYRSVQTQEDGPDGTRLVESTGYDDKGQKAYVSGPNHARGAPSDQRLQITPGEDRNRTVSTYDAVGRVIDESLWSYNKRLWGTTTSYGGSTKGWQKTVTPPAGETATATITDVNDDPIELREYHGGAPAGGYDATTYTYTPRGDLATVAKAGRTWRYEYDLRGREVATSDPDKGTTTVAYDNSDHVVSSTDATGAVVSTDYDALGRQTKRRFNGTLAAEWTYDTVAKGHLTKSVSYVDGQSFTREIGLYNDAYQVQDEESVIPAMPGLERLAGTFVSTTAYNVDGSVKSSTSPKVGTMEREIIAPAYDDLGNVTRLTGTSYPSGTVRVYVDKTTWSPYGEVLKRTLGDSAKPQGYQNYVYDDATRRLTEFYFDRDGAVPNVAALKYRYDDAGNVLSMANRPIDKDEKVRPGSEDVQCFGYDHLRRLTRAWSQTDETCAAGPSAESIGGVAPYGRSYQFDPAGSRTTVTDHRAATTSTYGYDDGSSRHAVRSVTTGERVDEYGWDVAGNLKTRTVGANTETFQWSPHGKLTKISGPRGETRMVYDVDGNRVARIDPNGTATAFVYGHEFASSSRGVSTTRYYQHAGDTVAVRTDTVAGPGDVIWVGADQHDSAAWAVNSVTRVETVRYADPYGNTRGAGGPAWPAGQRGFVGGVADPTGLTLLGARFYDPTLGEFLSVDPEIDEYDPQRMHPYAYANNNPVTFSDPDGLFWGALKNAASKVANTVAKAATSTAKWVVNNAGTIASVAGTVAMVATFLPPPAQVVAAAAGAVAAVAGAIDAAKTCAGGDKMGCAVGIAGMIPGVRQAKNAARGVAAAKGAVKGAGKKADDIEDALSAARRKADEAAPIRPDKARPGVAEAIKMRGGKIRSATSQPGTPPTLHPKVQRILNLVPNRFRGKGHGKCGLAVCLTDALNNGENPRRAAAAAVTVRNRTTHPKHGTSVGPCNSCKALSFWFGLRWAGPWRWWNRGFFG